MSTSKKLESLSVEESVVMMPKSVLHPVVDLERWMNETDLMRVGKTIAEELNIRGLNSAEAIRRAPNQLVAALTKAYGLEASRIISHFLKEES